MGSLADACREEGASGVIRVQRQPEPPDFDEVVRQPGLAYLRLLGIDPDAVVPQKHPWKKCWRACADQLYNSYSGICAYFAVRIHRRSGSPEPDHFLPKSKASSKHAYEWDNYRLACHALNNIKGEKDGLIDPFEVGEDWFLFNFIDGGVYPNPQLPQTVQDRIADTIERLHLSDGDSNMERLEAFEDYRSGRISRALFARDYPFLFQELTRQGLV